MYGAAPQKVQVIEEDVYQDMPNDTGTIRSIRSIRSAPPIYTVSSPMMNDPGSTYYSAVGRPFAVAFNDNTFNSIGYATSDLGMYSTTGKRIIPQLAGDDEIVIINGGGSDVGGGYYSGNKYAVAYNDRTFNDYSSQPRFGSIRYYN